MRKTQEALLFLSFFYINTECASEYIHQFTLKKIQSVHDKLQHWKKKQREETAKNLLLKCKGQIQKFQKWILKSLKYMVLSLVNVATLHNIKPVHILHWDTNQLIGEKSSFYHVVFIFAYFSAILEESFLCCWSIDCCLFFFSLFLYFCKLFCTLSSTLALLFKIDFRSLFHLFI